MSKRQQTTQEPIKKTKESNLMPPRNPNAFKGDENKMFMKLMRQSKHKEVLALGDSPNKNVLLDLDTDRIKNPSKDGGKFICFCSSLDVMTHKAENPKKEKISSFLMKKSRKRGSMSSLDDMRTLTSISTTNENKTDYYNSNSKIQLFQKEYNIIIPGKEQRKCSSVQKLAVLTDYNINPYDNETENNLTEVRSQNYNHITVKKAIDLRQSNYINNKKNALTDNNNNQITTYTNYDEHDHSSHENTYGSNNPSSFRPIISTPTALNNNATGRVDYNGHYTYSNKKSDQGGRVDFNKLLDYSPYKRNIYQQKISLIQNQWRKHFQMKRIKRIILLQSYWRRFSLRWKVYKFLTTYYRLRAFKDHIRNIKVSSRFIYKKEFFIKLKKWWGLSWKKPSNTATNTNANISRNSNSLKPLKGQSLKMNTQDKSKTCISDFNNNTATTTTATNTNNANKTRSKREVKQPLNKDNKSNAHPLVPDPNKSFSLYSNAYLLKIENTSFVIKAKKTLLDDIAKKRVKSFIIDNSTSDIAIENSMSIKAYYYEQMYSKLIREIEEMNKVIKKNNNNSKRTTKEKGINCFLNKSPPAMNIDNKIRLTYESIQRDLMLKIAYNGHLLIPQSFLTKFTKENALEHINDIHFFGITNTKKASLNQVEELRFTISPLLKINQFKELLIPNNGDDSNSELSFAINGKKLARAFLCNSLSLESINLSSLGAHTINQLNTQKQMNQIKQCEKFSIAHSNEKIRSGKSNDGHLMPTCYKSSSFNIDYQRLYTKMELSNSIIASLYQMRLSSITQSAINQLEYINQINKSNGFNHNILQLADNTLFSLSTIKKASLLPLHSNLIQESNFDIQFILPSLNSRQANNDRQQQQFYHRHHYSSNEMAPLLSFTIASKRKRKEFISLTKQQEKSLSFVACCPLRIIHKEKKIARKTTVNSSLLEEEEDLMNKSCSIKLDRLSLCSSSRTMPLIMSQIQGQTRHMTSESLFLSWRQSISYKQSKFKFIFLLYRGKNQIVLCKALIKWHQKTSIVIKNNKEEESSFLFDSDIINSSTSDVLREKAHPSPLNSLLPSHEENSSTKVRHMKQGISFKKINSSLFTAVVRKRFQNWRRVSLLLKTHSYFQREKILCQCVLKRSKQVDRLNTVAKQKYILQWFNPFQDNTLSNALQPYNNKGIKMKRAVEDSTLFFSCQNYFTDDLAVKYVDKSMLDFNISKISNDIANNNDKTESNISEDDLIIPIRNNLRLKRVTKTNTDNQMKHLRKSNQITKQKKMKMIKRYVSFNNNAIPCSSKEFISLNRYSNAIVSIITKKHIKITQMSLRKYFTVWNKEVSSILSSLIAPQKTLKDYFTQWVMRSLKRDIKVPSRVKRIITQRKAKHILVQILSTSKGSLTISKVFKTWKKRAFITQIHQKDKESNE